MSKRALAVLALVLAVLLAAGALPAAAQPGLSNRLWKPTVPPTQAPALQPTEKPSVPPTDKPTAPPTQAPQLPTAKPPVPPTSAPTAQPTATQKATAVPTPLPTKDPSAPTPTPKGTAAPTPTLDATKPTALPTPTGKATAPATPITWPTDNPSKPTAPPTPGGDATPGGTGSNGTPTADASAGNPSVADPQSLSLKLAGLSVSIAEPQVISGRVFDDQNGNGRQDANEAGIAGVPVTLDGHVVAATDAGGRFTVPIIVDTRLAVVPPQGWQWSGDALLSQDLRGEVAIPLRHAQTPVITNATVATSVTGGVTFLALAGLAILTGFASLSQAAALRTLERTYRRQKTQEFELALVSEMSAHLAHVRQKLGELGNPEPWRDVMAQLLADAGLGSAASLYPQEVSAEPCPHVMFSGAGASGQVLFLATQPELVKQWRDRVIALDTGLSHFARVEAQALWEYFAANKITGERPVVPRDAAWYLVVSRTRQKRLAARPLARRWF